MGALGAVLIAAFNPPPLIALPLALITGLLMGALWGLIAGLFRALRNVNEVVVTIMLNWIAFWIVEYARTYGLGDPRRQEKTISNASLGKTTPTSQGNGVVNSIYNRYTSSYIDLLCNVEV